MKNYHRGEIPHDKGGWREVCIQCGAVRWWDASKEHTLLRKWLLDGKPTPYCPGKVTP